MKRILLFILAVGLAAFGSACGSSGSDNFAPKGCTNQDAAALTECWNRHLVAATEADTTEEFNRQLSLVYHQSPDLTTTFDQMAQRDPRPTTRLVYSASGPEADRWQLSIGGEIVSKIRNARITETDDGSKLLTDAQMTAS